MGRQPMVNLMYSNLSFHPLIDNIKLNHNTIKAKFHGNKFIKILFFLYKTISFITMFYDVRRLLFYRLPQ